MGQQHQENVQRQALADWVEVSMDGKLALAVTLTLRRAMPEDWLSRFERMRTLTLKRPMKVLVAVNGKELDGAWIRLTRAIEEREIQHLLVRVHKKLGGEYRSGNRALQRVFTHEGDGDAVRKHLHGLVEVPPGFTPEAFGELLLRCWRGSMWALPRVHLEQVDSVTAWTHYVTKSGLENLSVRTLHV